MRPITEFEEFQINEYSVTTDLGSTQYHPSSDTLTIQGHAIGEGAKRQIEIEVQHEESVTFDFDRPTEIERELDFRAGIIHMTDIESGKTLYHV